MAESPSDSTGPKGPDHALPAGGRRSLLRLAVWGGGIAGLGAAAGYALNKVAGSRPQVKPKRAPLGDEFTYNVERFQKSDPALLKCVEVKRFAVGIERPRNLTVMADGAILVCGDGGVRKFSPTGEAMSAIKTVGAVLAVAAGPKGEILAGLEGKIGVHPAGGGEPSWWADLPSNILPVSIAVAKQHIYVADAANRVVMRFDQAGKALGVIGERDLDKGVKGFVVPSPYFCVRMAPDGLLRIANPGEHKIEAWTPEGALELAWGKASFAVDGFCGCCNPVSFDLFPDGSFVTCEKGLPRVKLYDSHGEFTGLVAGPDAFPGFLQAANAGNPEVAGAGLFVAVDPEERILVLDVIAGEVRVFQRKEQGNG